MEGAPWTVAAAVWWLAFAVHLVRADLRTHRLPAVPVAAMSVGTVLLLAGTADWSRLGRAALTGLALAAVLFVLCLPRNGIGLGDATIAFPIGLALGWTGRGAIPLWLLGASLLACVTALGLLLARRLAWRSTLPLGPFLLGAVPPAVWLAHTLA